MRAQLIDLDYEFASPFRIKELIVPYFINNHHFHNDYELVYVVESTGTRFIGDHIGKFRNGDLVFMGPNLSHAWFNDKEYYQSQNGLVARSIVTYFKWAWLHETILKLPESEKLAALLENATRGISIKGKATKHIARLLLETQNATGIKKSANLLYLLHEIAEAPEYELLAGITYVNQRSFKETKRMNDIYEFIIKNFSEKIMLEDAASIASMSSNAFSRYFKNQTQKTFSNFVNEVRIGHACKLLQADNLNVTEICYECGFNSMTNFIKFFKRITGKNPLQYRKEMQNANAAPWIAEG